MVWNHQVHSFGESNASIASVKSEQYKMWILHSARVHNYERNVFVELKSFHPLQHRMKIEK